MTNIKILYLLIAIFVLGTTADAQTRRKKVVRKPQPVKVEQNPADVLYENMLGSTARVMFIDSVVTDKTNFLAAIPLSRESGSLETYDAFWKTAGQRDSYTYMNEFGNKVLFSKKGIDGLSHLYTADKLNGQWSTPKEIEEFGSDFEDINCPYMMSDGVTLYFAAKGKNGVGGYDIYVTMYDTDSARFYKPENIGLPYNSRCNDYYCVIDEFNSLGWLVTDRNQPDGKVCVYTFVPSESRQTYDEDEMDEEKLQGFAAISSIHDTWTNNSKLQAARSRLAALKNRNRSASSEAMSFYINDNTVYTKSEDFKVSANRQRYAKLVALKAEKTKLEAGLETMRKQFGSSSSAARAKLVPAILKAERQSEQLDVQTDTLELEIRNAENKAITK